MSGMKRTVGFMMQYENLFDLVAIGPNLDPQTMKY